MDKGVRNHGLKRSGNRIARKATAQALISQVAGSSRRISALEAILSPIETPSIQVFDHAHIGPMP